MWLLANETFRLIIDTPSGHIMNTSLPAAALIARFGSSAINAPDDGEILRFTAMQGGHLCGDLDLCDQDPTPPTLNAYRLVIQQSDDHGATWR
jgi:hypothetical protein